MFSTDIVASDAFLDMSTTTRELYFQLGMYADDDGFVNPRKIMRMVGASADDLNVLVAKRFLLSFESGVVVIKHWLIHNLIRGDRYKETMYLDEKKTLIIKDNKSYTQLATNGIPNGNQMATQVKLSKVKLSKDKIIQLDETSSSEEIPLVIKSFEEINPACKSYYGNKTQRKACQELIDAYTLERVVSVIEKTLPRTNGLKFFPTITTPVQLRDKWVALESAVRKFQAEKVEKQKTKTFVV